MRYINTNKFNVTEGSYLFKVRYLNADGTYSKKVSQATKKWVNEACKANMGLGNTRAVLATYYVTTGLLEIINKSGAITVLDINNRDYKLQTFSKRGPKVDKSQVVSRLEGAYNGSTNISGANEDAEPIKNQDIMKDSKYNFTNDADLM